VETLPAQTVRQLAAAAERTLRSAAAGGLGPGRTVGERVLRDALLDHVAVAVEATVPGSGAEHEVIRVPVSQRLVQAVVRMGFLGRAPGRAGGPGEPGGGLAAAEPPVYVLVAGRFVGLAAQYGVAWHQTAVSLPVRAIGRTDEHL
jgi:hypothetical protein